MTRTGRAWLIAGFGLWFMWTPAFGQDQKPAKPNHRPKSKPAAPPAPAPITPETRPAAAEDDPYVDPFEGTTSGTRKIETLRDPLEKWNRRVYRFNDKFYFVVLKPATRGYRTVVPKVLRRTLRNFFGNLLEPVYFVNSVLQGKSRDASSTLSRFVVNSTVGVGGLFVPMKNRSEESKRNFDQTFAKWGVKPGIYVVWPFIGSSSLLRGTIGLAGEEAMDPFNYAGAGVGAGSSILETVNTTSFQLGAYEDFKKYTVDSYSSLKDIYEKNIHKKALE